MRTKLNKKQVRQLLRLLPKEYADMNCKIRLYHSKIQLFLSICLNPVGIAWFRELFDDTFGQYSVERNRIELYLFKQRKENFTIDSLTRAYDLFHELRHGHQWNYQNDKYKMCFFNYKYNDEDGYSDQEIEIDANDFATNICTMHKREISEIFGVDEKYWTIEGK